MGGRQSGDRVRHWPFVGRVEQRRWLLDRLVHGTGAVIVSAAGMGKSRLLAEVLDEAGSFLPQPVLVRIVGGERSIDAPFAALADVIGVPVEDCTYAEVWRRTRETFLRPAERGDTVVLCVDDAHALDAASAAWVLRLAATGAVRIVVAVRPDAPAADAITALWKDSYLDRLDLPPLGDDDVVAVLDQVLCGTVPSLVTREFIRRSGGVPLYLRELVDAALTGGNLTDQDGVWTLSGDLPVGTALTGLIGAKLQALGPEERSALLLAAIAGPLRTDLADSLAGMDVWTRLSRLGMLGTGRQDGHDVVVPAHPVYAEVAVGLADPAQVQAAKRALIEALSEAYGGTEQLSGHELLRVAGWRLELGDTGDATLLARAAAFAGISGDGRLAGRLAQVSSESTESVGTTLALARSLLASNRYEEADRILSRMNEQFTERHEALEYLQIRIMAFLWHLDRSVDAERLLDRAAHWWPDPDWGAQVEQKRVSALTESGHFVEACAIGDRVLRGHEPGTAEWITLARDVAFAHAMSGPESTARTLFSAIWRYSSPLDGSPDWSQFVAFVSSRIYAASDLDQVAEAIAAAGDTARRVDHVEAAAVVCYLDGWSAAQRGAADRAETLLRSALVQLEFTDSRGFRSLVLAELVKTAALQADPVAARQYYERMRTAVGGGRLRWNDEFRCGQAAARLARVEGEPDRGAREALAAADRLRHAPLLRARLLHEALRCGHDPAEIGSLLAPLSARLGTPLISTSTRHAEALARSDAAALDGVAADFSECGLPVLAVEVAIQAADLHQRSSRPAAAELSRAAGRRWLRACPGAKALEAGSPLEMSDREREILLLVAEGRTNRDIAERLHLSVRTVESHIYRVSRRSGVRRRRDLATLVL